MKLCAGCAARPDCSEMVPAGKSYCTLCQRAKPRSPSGHASRTAAHRRLRPVVFARDGYRCVKCGREVELHGDRAGHLGHRVAAVDGGESSAANYQTECASCNLSGARAAADGTPGG
jgi:5-methylcytosine-specific restriction endonuclease McrA